MDEFLLLHKRVNDCLRIAIFPRCVDIVLIENRRLDNAISTPTITDYAVTEDVAVIQAMR